jgi:hypothetical protein
MLTHAFPLPITNTAVRDDMDGPKMLRCATSNTLAFHIFHTSLHGETPWQEQERCASYPLEVIRYCISIPYSPHFPHSPCLWHWLSRCRANSAKSYPFSNADTLSPHGTGFFVPGNKPNSKIFLLLDRNLSL